MRNKRYIVSFLLFISMIMLVVPVIPHHHHADGVICMKNDLTPEPQCPKHYHHPDNDSCCNDGCMTRLNSPTLRTGRQQSSLSVYRHLIYGLYHREFIQAPGATY